MPVSTQNKEYQDNLPIVQLVRDCVDGEKAIKSRAKGGRTTSLNGNKGTAYLPAPNSYDLSSENQERYEAYLERAMYTNFTGFTKEGMLGLIFRKETVVEAPQDVEYLVKNANGAGLTLDQLIKDTASEVITAARYGILVDYPRAEPGLTDAQVKMLDLKAKFVTYPYESVINWKTMIMGGIETLSLVVLTEPTEKHKDDMFECEIVDYHRVLLLKEIDGKLTYVQNIYDEGDNQLVWDTGLTDDLGEPIFNGDIIPTKNDGSTWNNIPFIFIGALNNDPKVDRSPLYDIATVNISHYRNSADYEESSFMVGQPTPVLAGLTNSWVKDVYNDKPIGLGSRSAIMLPVGGSADLLQADPNQMPLKGMEMKEMQLVKLGARLIKDSTGVETAEAARIRFAGENSKLGSIIKNVNSAFIQLFSWASEFMGGTTETLIQINTEFYDKTLDPQMVAQLIMLMDRGVLAKKDLRDNMRKANLIDSARTDEDIDTESENITNNNGEFL